MPETKLCPREKRREFYCYFHAFQCFAEAHQYLYILRSKPNLNSDLQRSLTMSIAIYVARPFRQQGSKMRLPEDIVPKEHSYAFKHVSTLRDKAVAHVDTDKFKTKEHGNLNKVYLKGVPEGIAPVLSAASFGDEDLGRLEPLVNYLADHCGKVFTEILNEYPCEKPDIGQKAEIDILSNDDKPLCIITNNG